MPQRCDDGEPNEEIGSALHRRLVAVRASSRALVHHRVAAVGVTPTKLFQLENTIPQSLPDCRLTSPRLRLLPRGLFSIAVAGGSQVWPRKAPPAAPQISVYPYKDRP